MKKSCHKITFQPTLPQLNQLKKWMAKENQHQARLYHHIEGLELHYKDQTLALIIDASNPIGFVTWDIYKRICHISNTAIIHERRKLGLGRLLIDALFIHLAQAGILAVYLKCVPIISERFWRKMDFQKMPLIPGYSDRGQLCLYKLLTPFQEHGRNHGEYLYIYEYGSTKTISWPLIYKYNSAELIKPIIMPTPKDWLISFVKGGVEEPSKKIKNFQSGKCYEDPFLIITQIN